MVSLDTAFAVVTACSSAKTPVSWLAVPLIIEKIRFQRSVSDSLRDKASIKPLAYGLPGRSGGYPAAPPTDPDVQNSRIRFLSIPAVCTVRITSQFDDRLAHNFAAHRLFQIAWVILGVGNG
jgi:hypothetical protein